MRHHIPISFVCVMLSFLNVSLVDQDFRGRYRAHEGLIFFGYGVSERLAFEIEAAVISAKQYKSKDDPSSMPDKLKESGLGDVESQLRWRWRKESISRPEFYSYFETGTLSLMCFQHSSLYCDISEYSMYDNRTVFPSKEARPSVTKALRDDIIFLMRTPAEQILFLSLKEKPTVWE